MAISRVIIIVVAIVIIGLVALYAYSALVTTSSSSNTWSTGSAYPLEASDTSGVVGQACVNSTSTIYCIGGLDYNGSPRNDVYSATVSSTSMSGWSSATEYPETVGLQACAASGGYVYCVGGSYDDAGDDISSSFYAPISQSGVGPWSSTTSYPVPIDSEACVTSSGYIYCVGGENETNGQNATVVSTNSAWYAPISSTGIGQWNHTTAYPQSIAFESCAASTTEIFCLGGIDSSDNGVDNVYYAPLSSAGIGDWSSTTAYPMDAYGQVCVVDSSSIICVGGIPNGTTSASNGVYSAPVSSSGVGSWYQAANYPFGVETACAVSADNLYCVGGYQDSSSITGDTYYASVQSLLG